MVSGVTQLLRAFAFSSIAILCTLVVSPAAAQPVQEIAAAKARFEEGMALLRQGARDEACAKFAASVALYPSVSAEVKHGKCLEQDGKLALALAAYEKAFALARETRPNETEQRRLELEAAARASLEALSPDVPRLKITVSPRDAAGLRTLLGGVDIATESLGGWIPVDPGTHEVVVTATGYREARREITVKKGEVSEITMPLVPEPSEAPVGPPASQPIRSSRARSAVPRRNAPASRDEGQPQRIAGGVLIALGGAGLVSAAGLGIATLVKVSDSNSHCDEADLCKPEGIRLREEAGTLQNAGLIALGASAALATTGVIVVLTAPPDEQPVAGFSFSAGATARGPASRLTLEMSW